MDAGIDYFLTPHFGFPWEKMPPVVVGRPLFDNFLVTKFSFSFLRSKSIFKDFLDIFITKINIGDFLVLINKSCPLLQLWFARQPSHNVFDVDVTDTVFALHIGTSAKRSAKTIKGNLDAIKSWTPLSKTIKPNYLQVAVRGRTECMRFAFTNNHSPYASLYSREFAPIKCGNTCCTKKYITQKLKCNHTNKESIQEKVVKDTDKRRLSYKNSRFHSWRG